jgi:hypothetical protein
MYVWNGGVMFFATLDVCAKLFGEERVSWEQPLIYPRALRISPPGNPRWRNVVEKALPHSHAALLIP